jgi:hypothetical protein
MALWLAPGGAVGCVFEEGGDKGSEGRCVGRHDGMHDERFWGAYGCVMGEQLLCVVCMPIAAPSSAALRTNTSRRQPPTRLAGWKPRADSSARQAPAREAAANARVQMSATAAACVVGCAGLWVGVGTAVEWFPIASSYRGCSRKPPCILGRRRE